MELTPLVAPGQRTARWLRARTAGTPASQAEQHGRERRGKERRRNRTILGLYFPSAGGAEGSRAGGDARASGCVRLAARRRKRKGSSRGKAAATGGRKPRRRRRAPTEEAAAAKRGSGGRRHPREAGAAGPEGGAGGRAQPIRGTRPFFGVSQARRWGDATALGRGRERPARSGSYSPPCRRRRGGGQRRFLLPLPRQGRTRGRGRRACRLPAAPRRAP